MLRGVIIESHSPLWVRIGMLRVLMVLCRLISPTLRVAATTTTTTTLTSATADTNKPSYSKRNGGRRDNSFLAFAKIFLSATLVTLFRAKGSAL